MKTRIALTVGQANLDAIQELSDLMGKSKSAIIDELLTESNVVFITLATILKKAKHLDQLAKNQIKEETKRTEKDMQKMVDSANHVLFDMDAKITAQILKMNRKKPPVSNTGVRK